MKKASCVFLALMIALSLAACQPTPEKAAVADKSGALEKKINEPAVPDNPMLQTVPQTWTEETTYQSGVKLAIDAVIQIPDADKYPVIEALPREITMEEVQALIDVLMQGQPVFEATAVRTKSDWEADILKAKAEIEDLKMRDGITEQERQQKIEEMNDLVAFFEQQYQNAPATKPERVPAVIAFKPESDGMQSVSVQAELGKERPALFTARVCDNGLRNYISFSNHDGNRSYVEIYADTYAGMALSHKQAQDIAEAFLHKLGITGMHLAYTDVVAVQLGMWGEGDLSAFAQDPQKEKNHKLEFCPVISGIPVTANRYLGSGEEKLPYDQIWIGESIYIYVDDQDVICMEWWGRGKAGEVLNENIELLDFEQIKETFNTQMFYQRSWSAPHHKDTAITIEKVTLGMMRVRLRENKYVYLPVWDFIGDWTYAYADGDGQFGMYDISLMTINAIDGSVIDRGVGY